MSIADILTRLAPKIPQVYEKGKTDFGYQKSVSGNDIRIDDINVNEKKLSVVLTSDSVTDFSNTEITVCGGENILKMPNYVGVNTHTENADTQITTVIKNGVVTMSGYLGYVAAGGMVFNPYIPEHLADGSSSCHSNTLDPATAIKLPKGTYTYIENRSIGSMAKGRLLVYVDDVGETRVRYYNNGQSFTVGDNCCCAFIVDKNFSTDVDIPDFYYSAQPMLVCGDVDQETWERYIGKDYTANSDGIIYDITPYYPITIMFVKGDSDAVINTEYYTDVEKVIQNLTDTIISLGGTV